MLGIKCLGELVCGVVISALHFGTMDCEQNCYFLLFVLEGLLPKCLNLIRYSSTWTGSLTNTSQRGDNNEKIGVYVYCSH